MQIIVSDTSCLIDLRKGHLLDAFLELPYELVIPDVLLDDELLSFAKSEIALLRRKMTVATLDSESVERVGTIIAEVSSLSVYDGFAFVAAEERPGCILLTGDRRLRDRAEASDIECRGILWVVDEIRKAKTATMKALVKALEPGAKIR
jgi:rRNA-processing protein FCF1